MPIRLAAVLATALLALPPTAAAQSHGFSTGFSDAGAFTNPAAPADNLVNLARAREAGARYIRFGLDWRDVAPTQPPTREIARDPSWAGYDWTQTDIAIRSIVDAGLHPLPIVLKAPRWAEGADRPTAPGALYDSTSWKPSPADLEAFAGALAIRYSGTFTDPAHPGAPLPRVERWQAWNEPNLDEYLTPQWTTRRGRKPVPASPGHYRLLLNAFYRGMKRIMPSNTVITAGTAPFGNPDLGGGAMPPARFWRELLCVTGRKKLRAGSCRDEVWFDAYAHHPYPIGPPRRTAINVDDVVVPDLRKITKPLALAMRRGTVRPTGPKPLWITEISWDSKPDPTGLSQADQARYMAGAFNVLWQQGASVVLWYTMRDEAPVPSWGKTFQSGIFQRGDTIAEDRRKPSYTAFAFPFTAYRSEGVAHLWGVSPTGRVVTVERRVGDEWRPVMTIRPQRNRVFVGRLRVSRGADLRAVSGPDVSRPWTTF